MYVQQLNFFIWSATNSAVTEQSIHDFVKELNVSDAVKAEIMAITPYNYTGM